MPTTTILLLFSWPVRGQAIALHLHAAGYGATCSEPTLTQALHDAQQTPPDVALIDVTFDDNRGFQAAHCLLVASPVTRVVLCLRANPAYLLPAIQTNASGYLPPDFDWPELESCLGQVANGFRYISPRFAEWLGLPLPVYDPLIAERMKTLTKREKEVLCLVCRGYMQKEIAAALGIVESTVVSFKKSSSLKLGLGSRRDLPFFLMPYQSLLG